MCPLRVILIFLSATLAGFFFFRNLNSHTNRDPVAAAVAAAAADDDSSNSTSRLNKVGMAMKSGFWTCVDMASGRYLWRHLSSSSS